MTKIRQYMEHIKSFVTITVCNQACIACIFHALGFPYNVYKEYNVEHVVPIKESLYARFTRFVGLRGKIASTAITMTQALTENCIVCLSQRKDAGFGVGAADGLRDEPELCVRGWAFEGDEVVGGADGFAC